MPIQGKKITEPAKEFENYYVEQFLVTSSDAPEKGGKVILRATLRPYNAQESAAYSIPMDEIDMLFAVNPDNFESNDDKALATEGAQVYSAVLVWLAKKAKKVGVI